MAALSLLPVGTVAVAVFPPYAIPRTFPAITIVFREDDTTTTRSKRRSLHYFNKPFLNHNPIKYALKSLKHYFKCFRTRLDRHLGIEANVQPNKTKENTNTTMIECDRECRRLEAVVKKTGRFPNFDQPNSQEECFDDYQSPLYGFRTNITCMLITKTRNYWEKCKLEPHI